MMTKKEIKRATGTDTERESIRVEKYTLNERTAIQKKSKRMQRTTTDYKDRKRQQFKNSMQHGNLRNNKKDN